MNTVAAPTEEEALARALPQLRAMVRLRTNQPSMPLETIEQAQAAHAAADAAARSDLIAAITQSQLEDEA